MAVADDLASMLAQQSYRFDHERELQDSIGQVLHSKGIIFEREVEIGRKDIIDFVVPTLHVVVGIEVKIKAGLSEVTRQLHRYALSDKVGVLLLATCSRRLAAALPRELNGKRVVFATLGGVL